MMGKVAILIPCFNEAVTIRKVVEDFKQVLPFAEIHVFDNNSNDGTADIARAAGAVVHSVHIQGKGAVVRHMFRVIDADVGVMVDGDDTYPANDVVALMTPVINGHAEMTVATRLSQHASGSFRPLHMFGNRLVLRSINTLFSAELSDVLSGYRAFSRRFMKTCPVLSRGFEIEAEITLHALEHQLPLVEVPVSYGARPEGSFSKLHTFRDGFLVLRMIARLYKDYRPLWFFGWIGGAAIVVSLLLGLVIIDEWMTFGRAGPARAVLAVAMGLFGALSVMTGLVLDTVNRRARELMVLLTDHVIDVNGVSIQSVKRNEDSP